MVGHGAGSFAHVPAKKYKTKEGLLGENSLYGLAKTAQTAGQLNGIVMEELLNVGVEAVSISPKTMMMAENDKLVSIDITALETSLELGLLPVVYGDVIFGYQKRMYYLFDRVGFGSYRIVPKG